MLLGPQAGEFDAGAVDRPSLWLAPEVGLQFELAGVSGIRGSTPGQARAHHHPILGDVGPNRARALQTFRHSSLASFSLHSKELGRFRPQRPANVLQHIGFGR